MIELFNWMIIWVYVLRLLRGYSYAATHGATVSRMHLGLPAKSFKCNYVESLSL